MITITREKLDEIERMAAHLAEGVATLELLAGTGCGGSDEDPRGNDALFFIARALQAKVDEVLEWHLEIVSPSAKD
jgi:hypothetical protein